MNRRTTGGWFPNDTPVVVIGSTVHLADGSQARCGAGEGRPTILVLPWTYPYVQWHPRCFPTGRP